MKFYVSEELDKVLTEEEYKELLNKEIEIRDFEDLKDSICYVDNMLKFDIYGDNEYTVGSSMCEDISSTIDNLSYTYPVTDNWGINVKFEIVELDEEHLENSCIKVTNIELIQEKK